MPIQPSSPPKPVSEVWRPEPAALAHAAALRSQLYARTFQVIAVSTKCTVEGLGTFSASFLGPALVVVNHLGDADAPLLVGSISASLDALGKIELYDFPVLGKLMDWYGIIWLHRGQADRRAIRAALDGFAEVASSLLHRRDVLVGGLEEGEQGAAFLALKADVPVSRWL